MADTPNWERLGAFTPPTGEKPFDDWIAPKRATAIGRILEEVKKYPDSGIDLRTSEIELATSIYRAFIETSIKLDPHESSKAGNRLKKVQRFLKGVRKQVVVVNTDPYLSKRITKAAGLAMLPVNRLLFDLQSLENELSWRAKRWQSKVDVPVDSKGRRASEREWLAGVSLPLIYERHFRIRAGRSQSATGGPTVRFIAATLREFGVSYGTGSIQRAMTRLARFRNGSKEDYRS